jgi:hypothetical protein
MPLHRAVDERIEPEPARLGLAVFCVHTRLSEPKVAVTKQLVELVVARLIAICASLVFGIGSALAQISAGQPRPTVVASGYCDLANLPCAENAQAPDRCICPNSVSPVRAGRVVTPKRLLVRGYGNR